MINASDQENAHERGDTSFVVRFTGRHAGFYLARMFPLFALFAGLALLYLDDDSRRTIFSRFPSAYKPFSWLEYSFLLALMMAPVLDLILTLSRSSAGKMALVVAPEGITGAVIHRTRLLGWNEIADVTRDGKFIVVHRKPKSLFQKIFAVRGFGDINVPAQHLDRDVLSILAAVRQFAPARHLLAAVR